MTIIKRKSIQGQKFVVKQFTEKEMAKICTTSQYHLYLDNELEWEADNEKEILDFLENWGK